MAGTYDVNNPPKIPGLYINFVEAAKAQLTGGQRGAVAIPLKVYTGGTAVAGKVYEVSDEAKATELFGAGNIQSINFALQAGAQKVVVYTLPKIDELNGPTKATVYADARLALDAYEFNVFVFDGEEMSEQDEVLAWVQKNRNEGKHFFVVFGGTSASDADFAQGNARSTLNADDYVINLINGVEIGEVAHTSSAFAPFVAGLVASVGLNKSLTFQELPVTDVALRMTRQQIADGLAAGSFVIVNDGEKVKVVQGLVTNGKKIRAIKTRQAISNDVAKIGEDQYIGKISNNADGQAALTSSIKAYLEELEKNQVLKDIKAGVDTALNNSGDTVNLFVSYEDVESVEKILLAIRL